MNAPKMPLWLLFIQIVSGISAHAGVMGVFHGQRYNNIENANMDLDEKWLDVDGLVMERATLGAAQRHFGAGTIVERRYTSGRYQTQICYEASQFTLLLESQSQQREKSTIDTVYIARRVSPNERFGACARSPKVSDEVSFMGGLKLGMSPAQIEQKWGKPGKAAPGVMIYVIRRKQKEFFTDDISMYFMFEKNHLVRAELSRVSVP